MEKSGIFQDNKGNTSSTRVIMFLVIIPIITIWCTLCIMTTSMVEIPLYVWLTIMGAMGLKVSQGALIEAKGKLKGSLRDKNIMDLPGPPLMGTMSKDIIDDAVNKEVDLRTVDLQKQWDSLESLKQQYREMIAEQKGSDDADKSA